MENIVFTCNMSRLCGAPYVIRNIFRVYVETLVLSVKYRVYVDYIMLVCILSCFLCIYNHKLGK